MIIKMADGSVYPVELAGVSSVTQQLAMNVMDMSVQQAFAIFTDAERTQRIAVNDEREDIEVCEGYTELAGLLDVGHHTVQVWLKKPEVTINAAES